MKRRLLFLPGAGADPEFWKPVGNLLPDNWEKIYFGWPGLGNQKPVASVKCLDDMVAMVEEALSDDPVDILAQSMGGRIATRLLRKHPEKIRRVVLSATGAGLDLTEFGGTDWKTDYRKDFPEAAHWFTDDTDDLSNDLPKIKQPVLILCGDADDICPLSVGKKLLELFPNATLEIVHGGDHSFARDLPHKVINAIMNHLK